MKKLLLLSLALLLSLTNYSQIVELNQIASNFSGITEIVNAGDDRLFVTEQAGRIRILNTNGSKSTFLDIRSRVSDNANERGLLGLAFAPDYDTTGRFYVNYTNNSGDTVIARYTVSSNPNVANNGETILLTIDQGSSNHNGGKILFGPDGFLYIGMGDGGGSGDQPNNSQNKNRLLGKLLRIDVSGSTYTIPSGNPYSNGGGKPEIYAIGLRNPWRMAFDSETNNLWIADVGQNAFEEINVVDYTVAGLNYGWRCYEGLSSFNNSGGCPPLSGTVQPIEVQSHNGDGVCSITGGYVYRGTNYPSFIGKYFYGDICSREIGIITNDNGNWVASYQKPSNAFAYRTFGEDVNKELYVASSSSIFQLTDPELSTSGFSKFDFKLYPNPADDSVNIDLGANYTEINTISIFNIQGQRVLETSTKKQQKIAISTEAFTSGIYIIEIASNEGLKSIEKLVIK